MNCEVWMELLNHKSCDMSGMAGANSIQDSLIAALKRSDSNEVTRILSDHPELTNITLVDDHAQETSTPLIEACRRRE